MNKDQVTIDQIVIDTLPEYYVITGISTEDRKRRAHGQDRNERVFVGTDSHSGGYPYWSTIFGSANRYKDITEALKALRDTKHGSGVGYMANQATDIRLVAVRIDLVGVSEQKIHDEQVQAALDKLTADERRLLGV